MVSLAIWMVSRILDENTVIFIWALWLIAIGIFMDFLEPFEEDKKIQSRFKKLFAFISLLYGAILFIGAVAGATNPLKPFEPFTQKVVQEELNFQRVNNLKELQNIIDSNQKVMIKFSAKWCANCKKFKNTTLKDKEIISLLKNYKLVEIDVTNNTQNDKQILKYFEIVGPPAVIIFENGKQKPNILGYKSPKEFKSLL
jgi:thiol:disulfide interchange protein DsbD